MSADRLSAPAGSVTARPAAGTTATGPVPLRPAPRLRVVEEAVSDPAAFSPPPGRWLDLGRRGRTWVREAAGPAGAPSVLLLHGLGATGGLNWAGAQHFLSDRFRIVTVDHRGHGRGIPTSRFRLEDCADDAAAVVEALGMERPIVVGYSMGGPVAKLMWRRHRHSVGGLVLCATSRNFRGSPSEKVAFGAAGLAGLAPVALPRSLTRTGSTLFSALPRPGRVADAQFALDEVAGHDSRAILQATAALGRFDSSRWIRSLDVPTAVMVTTRDQIVPPERQMELARAIPGASLYPVAAGHLCIGAGTTRTRFLSALSDACDEIAERRRPGPAAQPTAG